MKTLKKSFAIALVVAFASAGAAYALESNASGSIKGLDANASRLYESGLGFKTDTATKVFYRDAVSGQKSWTAYNGGVDFWGVKGII